MNNPFKIFTHPIFGDIRVALVEGNPCFVGADAAKALGYVRADMAIKRHVAEEDKRTMLVATFQCMKEGNKPVARRLMTVINESGLYSLVLASKLPQAQEFKHWVTAEVLPSIRKTGSYSLVEDLPAPAEKNFPSPELADLQKQIDELKGEVEGLKNVLQAFFRAFEENSFSRAAQVEKLLEVARELPPDSPNREKIFIKVAYLVVGRKF